MEQLHRLIDHALLKSETTQAQIRVACRETLEHNLFGLAVNPVWIPLVAGELAGSSSIAIGVAGFPLGATSTSSKIAEALEQIKQGAREIDMVAQIGLLAAGEFSAAESEIAQVRAALPEDIPLKVIIEAPLLTADQIRRATQAVINGGAQFVKSATGFFGDSTVEIAETMIEAAGERVKVKISGGVRTLEQAEKFARMGADRLGSSASVSILRELREQTVRA